MYIANQKVNPNFNGYYNTQNKTKKIAVGASSFIVPGLGQVINGQTSKGIAFFLGSLCSLLVFTKVHKHKTLAWVFRLLIGALAANDAYKNAH